VHDANAQSKRCTLVQLTPNGTCPKIHFQSDFYAMSVSKVQVGQVWKKAGSDESFLVTRLYSEALTTFAVLRPAGKETAAVLRIKVTRKGASQALPGFSMAQDSDEF
jgi:hypothetical protein